MAKQVMLSDALIKKLDALKEKRGESYSKVIEACLKSSYDFNLDRINELFDELKRLIPNLRNSIELMRVLCVRFYRLPQAEQLAKMEDLDDSIKKVFNDLVSMIR
jgi:Mg2+ and Co2+ transporter CorA